MTQLRHVIVGACLASASVVIGGAMTSVYSAHQSDMRATMTLLNAVIENKLDALNLIRQGVIDRRYLASGDDADERGVERERYRARSNIADASLGPIMTDSWAYTRGLLRNASGLGETGRMFAVDMRYVTGLGFSYNVGWDQCYSITPTDDTPTYTDMTCSPAMVRAYYEGLHVEDWAERFVDHTGTEVFSLAIRIITAYGAPALLVVSIDSREAMAHMRAQAIQAGSVAMVLLALIAVFGMLTCRVVGRSLRAKEEAEARFAESEIQSLLIIQHMTASKKEQLALLNA